MCKEEEEKEIKNAFAKTVLANSDAALPYCSNREIFIFLLPYTTVAFNSESSRGNARK